MGGAQRQLNGEERLIYVKTEEIRLHFCSDQLYNPPRMQLLPSGSGVATPKNIIGLSVFLLLATAVFGAVLGTVLGLGLGVALQHGLASQGLGVLVIPWSLVATLLISSALVGVIAAALPSIRAVRLGILQAIDAV